MKKLRNLAATVGMRCLLLPILGVVLSAAYPEPTCAQEAPGFRLPDSLRTRQDSFFTPSMSPALSYVPPRFIGPPRLLLDQDGIDEDLRNSYHSSWKRSFLLGATSYRASVYQPSPWLARKATFFQKIQAVIGVAELAGVAYLGYKAIKKEPVTKKK